MKQYKETDPFYKSTPWKRARAARLCKDGGWCQPCQRKGRAFVTANTVHHIKPRKDYPQLALDINNLESLCPFCHNKEHPEKSFKNWNSKHGQPELRRAVRIIKV